MFFHILTLLRDSWLRWDAVFPLLDKMNTWYFQRSSFPVIISLYMLLMTIMLLFWYIPLQRVKIHWRLRLQIRMWLIIWEMIWSRKWNEKMVRCMMTLILSVGRSTKWMMTLNICLMKLKKILEINYTYISLTQPIAKEILWRVTTFFYFSENGRERGVIQSKKRWPEGKISCKVNEGVYFGASFNQWGYMVAWFRGYWCFLSFRQTLWTTWRWIHNWL